MINVITNIICSIMCGFSITYVSTQIGKLGKGKKEFLLSITIMTVLIYLTSAVKYISEINVLKVVLFIIILKAIYKEPIYKTIIIILITMLLMLVGEIVVSILLLNSFTVEDIRTQWYYFLISNFFVCLIMVGITKIRFISNKISKYASEVDIKDKLSSIILFSLSVFIIIYLLYNISVNYGWNEKYFINIIIMISYIVITIVFFKDKLEYNVLEEKYDTLFEYFSEIAESIDDLNLTTHEYKNQIAIVSNYIDNKKYKKAKEYIDDISNLINKDEGLLVNLTDIPTGGLKGLLYYKIIVAKNQKVEIVLDVGKNTKELFKTLSEEHMKIITRIVGVYIDNSISEVTKKNNMINIEIYNLNDNLVFAISNKISKDLDINKFGRKGYTTKGKGHGKGLYLTNKLINRNKWLKSETKLVNNYYVTKLIVDIKNIGK